LVVAKKIKKEAARDMGRDLLKQVGILEKENQYPIALSGGQQQRVGIARALAVNPYAILFDEPTSSLDPEWVGEVLRVISKIASHNKTMIIVTHEMNFARKIADKVIFMADGAIVEQGTPEEIFVRPQKERTKKFLKDVHRNNGVAEEPFHPTEHVKELILYKQIMQGENESRYKIAILDQSPIFPGQTAGEALKSTMELAQKAEEWGYERFWVSEHHQTLDLAGTSPEVLISHLLAKTTSIKVGSGGVMLQHYSPYKVAEDFQLLSLLSPGRVELG